MKKIVYLVISIGLILGISSQAHASNTYTVKRINGANRYETSINISNEFTKNNDVIDNIILANGESFPDALSGSVLSKKLNAPILLVNNIDISNSNAITYIQKHLKTTGTIYVLGGQASVSDSYLETLKNQGYTNIIRLGGIDRFNTNKAIVDSMNVQTGTPVVLVNGVGFADALSISSIVAIKGYPILMSNSDSLPDSIAKKISDINPSTVYIIGGKASISDNIVAQVKTLNSALKDSDIVRIGGTDRFNTSLNICKYFNIDTNTAVIASGGNFPDALSGSALAASLNAPIILTPSTSIRDQKTYLDTTKYSNLILLGGGGAISYNSQGVLDGTAIDTYKDSVSDTINMSLKGDWLYYRTQLGKQVGIYKVKTDGTQQTKLVDGDTQFLSVSGDWLYYVDCNPLEGGLYKIKTDGTDKTAVVKDTSVDYFTIIGDWIYYSGDHYFKRMKLDEPSTGTLIDDTRADEVISDGSYIYYTSGNSIIKAKPDGANRQVLYTADAHKGVFSLGLNNNKLYYIVLAAGDKFDLYQMNTDGTNITHMINTGEPTYGATIIGDWIYYSGQFQLLKKIDINGNPHSVRYLDVAQNGTVTFLVSGDWVYYCDDTYNYYKAKADGTGAIRLSHDN